MQTSMKLPVAFSVRDDHEFFPIQHLMARMNPKLMVVQVATGRHVDGGCTVLWGLVHEEGQPLAKEDVETALREAGFDFLHNQRVPALAGVLSQPTEAENYGIICNYYRVSMYCRTRRRRANGG
jgi:hypothetical protein